MFNGQPAKHLPRSLKKISLTAKIFLGVFILLFFSGYQPVFAFPPLRQNISRAQTEQSQTVQAKSLPFAFQNPHDGYISTHFSAFHPGIDITADLGTAIHPIAPGIVIDEGFNSWGLGLMVVVDHGNGYQSLYGHMEKILVYKGQKVTDSDVLGKVGITGHTTGPHTHLQVSKDGQNIDPQTLLPTLPDMPLH